MVFKQGFFMSQTRLLWSEKKSCFHCKEALFENAAVLIQKKTAVPFAWQCRLIYVMVWLSVG